MNQLEEVLKQNEVLRSHLREERTERLALAEKIKTLEESMTKGQGSTQAPKGPTKEDLAPFAKTKIEACSLEDVVETIAALNNQDIDTYVKSRVRSEE